MNKQLACLILLILLFCFVGCNTVEEVSGEFHTQLFNKETPSTPVRVAYFDSINGEENIDVESLNSADLYTIANTVLNKLGLSSTFNCLKATAINEIVIVEFGDRISFLEDNQKYIIAASFAETFRYMGGYKYLVIYSGGELVSFDKSTIKLMPIDLSVEVTPAALEGMYADFNNMLANNDDFTLPVVLWENNGKNFCVPRIYDLPILNDVISSLNNIVFYENTKTDAYKNAVKVISAPEFDENEAIMLINIFSNELSSFDAEAIVRTYKQFCIDFILNVREYNVVDPQNYSETNYTNTLAQNGFNIKYYHSDSKQITEEEIQIKNNDLCYSVVDYAVEQGARYYNFEKADSDYLFDAWVVSNQVVISVSENFINKCEQLEHADQRSFIYSIINTVCYNLKTTSVRFLQDGYTIKNIGVINAELPISYIS